MFGVISHPSLDVAACLGAAVEERRPRSAITALLPLIRPCRPCSVLGSDVLEQAEGDIGNEQYPWEALMSRHKFKIGQLVYYRAESASGTYQITQLLPPEGDEYQYRVKSVREPHERVAKEHELRSAA